MTKVGTTNEANRKEWLRQTLGAIPAGLKILDAGAGQLSNKPFCTHLEYVSQDFCQYHGTGDNKGLQTGTWDTHKTDIVSDITSIPEQDEVFDVILCSEVFEHLTNPLNAMKEFHRLLKPGGTLVLSAPFCSLTHFAPYHYSSGFNRYFYEYHLKDVGFTLDHISTNGNYFEYLAQELRRVQSMAKRYTEQKASLIERSAIKILLNMLARFSKHDSSSNELLCFGYHVIAKKGSK